MRDSPDNKLNFETLLTEKEAVESEFGKPLVWLPLNGKKSSRVAAYKTNVDPLDEANWPELLDWMQDAFDRFQRIFKSRIRVLPEVE